MLTEVTIKTSRQEWKNCVLGSAVLIMVITENIAPPLCIKEMNEKILKILNFFTSSIIAENILNENNLLNIRFLNLCDTIMPTKLATKLNTLFKADPSFHWVNFLS